MTPQLPLKPVSAATLARAANLDKRNQAIRDAFYTRYTKQARPRLYTREYVVSQLAQEYHLSMKTVETIVANKQK